MRERMGRQKRHRNQLSKQEEIVDEQDQNSFDIQLSQNNSSSTEEDSPFSFELRTNTQVINKMFISCSDFVNRDLLLSNGLRAGIFYIEGLADIQHLDITVLGPLMHGEGVSERLERTPPTTSQEVVERLLSVGKVSIFDTYQPAIDQVLKGCTLFLMEGYDKGMILEAKKWEHRLPSEPETESVIRGPREGFVETLRTNTGMLRRRIRSPKFKIESFTIGTLTQTDVTLSYIEGIVIDSLVKEVRKRLSSIQIDGVIDSGYLQEFLEDEPYSPFPQIQATERPDTAVACLLEGRCLILSDGSPFGLIMPVNLFGSLQANEDYYERFMFGTLIRWLRYIFIIMALTLPSLYVAVTTFHQEMIPTNLLLSLAAAREASPFPALIEALIMEVTFEALREAGVRLPKTVGQAVSIVGALVIGQAAVQAGIVSAPMVIIVSITGIANFTIPRYSLGLGIRTLRFPLMFLAGTFGLYGIVIGIIAIIVHLCSLRSFGVPFTYPLAPFSGSEMKDTLIRAPWFAMNKRPSQFAKQNPVRIPKGQSPKPPSQIDDQNRGDSHA